MTLEEIKLLVLSFGLLFGTPCAIILGLSFFCDKKETQPQVSTKTRNTFKIK